MAMPGGPQHLPREPPCGAGTHLPMRQEPASEQHILALSVATHQGRSVVALTLSINPDRVGAYVDTA